MRESERRKRNYLIIGLCSVLMIMAGAFAVFSQQLQINGTSEVTSSWDVHIKDNGVSYKNAVSATSTLAEKTSALVATFACTLTTPGTSTISYDIVVENKGSLNAVLDSINLTGGNTAISVVTSPTNASLATRPIILAPNDETTITVIVSYNDILTQPTGDGLSTDVTVTLNFSQTADDPVPFTQIVYAFPNDQCVSARCVEYYGGSLVISNGVSDYTQLSSYQQGKKNFVKFELDENDEIINTWVCMKYDFINDPVCMQNGSSNFGTASTGNKGILTNLSSSFTGASPAGSCLIEQYSASCTQNDLEISTSSSGEVEAFNYSTYDFCSIDSNEEARCD